MIVGENTCVLDNQNIVWVEGVCVHTCMYLNTACLPVFLQTKFFLFSPPPFQPQPLLLPSHATVSPVIGDHLFILQFTSVYFPPLAIFCVVPPGQSPLLNSFSLSPGVWSRQQSGEVLVFTHCLMFNLVLPTLPSLDNAWSSVIDSFVSRVPGKTFAFSQMSSHFVQL